MRLQYVLKRAGFAVGSIFVVANLLFFLFRLTPGDPSTVVADPTMPAEARQEILEQHGLTEPLYVQYVTYMQNLLTGDLGTSFQRNEPVLSILLDTTLNTIVLMLTSVLLAFGIGITIGAFLSWRRNTLIDTIGIGTIILFYAAPVFWTGMVGIMIFSFHLGWVPSGGMRSAGYSSDMLLDRYLSMDFLRHLALPLLVTTLYWLTAPTFIMRNNMIDVLGEDFIKMGRAQGLSERSLIYRHAARNSLLPVVHYGAIAVGFAFGGSVVIETVFSWPGVGRLMWQAVLQEDYPLAQGAFLMLATVIITLNFLVDMISVIIDPRTETETVT
ncbi:ABC transporter permease [Natrononativus amylolyticus]|uniref:ABC transporter permease n=1 Tax=Natrononativus amylolyticus TaxID=2963434 RepID=UPI0020CF3789|nr:ABC transporter permease [Natrononativus amylolyticus]